MIYPGSVTPLPAESSGRLRVVDYRADDGTALRGALCLSGTAGRPVLVYFHGNGESAGDNLGFASEITSLGWDLFLAEYRGYGGLRGSPTEDGLYRDGEAALAAVAAAGYAPERVILVGRSLGTGVAVEMARRGHGAKLVLVSPFTSMVEVARHHVGPLAGLVPDEYDSLDKVGALTIPVIVIHGTRDEVVPFALGERLAKAAHATLIPVEGHGHNDLPMLPETIDRALRGE